MQLMGQHRIDALMLTGGTSLYWDFDPPNNQNVTVTIYGRIPPGQDISAGLLTILCRHTSASLLIQENAAPAARRDLEAYFARIAPESTGYEHDDEGPDDMPAHLRSALTQSQLSIPVEGGRMPRRGDRPSRRQLRGDPRVRGRGGGGTHL